MGSKRGNPQGSEDLPKYGGQLPVAVAPQTGISNIVKSDALTAMVEAVLTDPRHEAYAQAVAGGASYAEAYRVAGYAHDAANAYKVSLLPLVATRIRMLKTAAAERRVCSIASRMQILDEMIHANPDELTRVVVQPCAACWTDEALAGAMGRYVAALGSAEPIESPNTDKPRHDCERCAGDGISRVVLTPTAELSAGARALFKSAKQNAKGEIIVETHDRLAAINALNAMQPGALAVSRHANLNLNSFIPAAREPTSIEELNRLLASFDDTPTPGG